MDSLFVVAVAELTSLSLFAIFLKSKIKIILILLIGVAISWYIGVIRVEIFNEMAIQEYHEGLREKFPSDGASNVFSFYFGWLPGLVYSSVVYGIGKLLLNKVPIQKNKKID